jgi:hypothetical protein
MPVMGTPVEAGMENSGQNSARCLFFRPESDETLYPKTPFGVVTGQIL